MIVAFPAFEVAVPGLTVAGSHPFGEATVWSDGHVMVKVDDGFTLIVC